MKRVLLVLVMPKKPSGNESKRRFRIAPKEWPGRIRETVHLIRTSSRFRHGTMATVMTAVFFVFIVLLNIIALRLADRYAFLRLDMTEDKRYTLTDATMELLDSVNETVEIDIMRGVTKANEMIDRLVEISTHTPHARRDFFT